MSKKPRDTAQLRKDRARIARNKPNCALCGQEIRYELKWPDPDCFVVDHIIPIAKGGRDDMSNKQACHARCNAAKAARDYAPIIRRSSALNR